jgi:uncharacterized alpha/beta hydrolase family protein
LNYDIAEKSIVTPMYSQLHDLINGIENLKQQYSIGQHHFVCHSQGALLCRAYLLETSNHKISLSGPQMGQFGLTFKAPYAPWINTENAYAILYTNLVQGGISSK